MSDNNNAVAIEKEESSLIGESVSDWKNETLNDEKLVYGCKSSSSKNDVYFL